MNSSYTRSLQLLFIILDILILNTGYFFAESLYEESEESKTYYRYLQYWIITNWTWITFSLLGAMYASKHILYFRKFLQKTSVIVVLHATLMLLFLFLPRVVILSSGLVYFHLLFFMTGLIFNRFLYLVIRETVKREVHAHRRILILGYNSLSRKLAQYIEDEEFNVKVLGFIDDRHIIKDVVNHPVIGGLEETMKISEDLQINEIYSTLMPENNASVYRIMDQADKGLIRFRVVPDINQFVDRPIRFDFLRDIPILSLRREPLEMVLNRFNKRLFDIVFSLGVTLFILSWLVPLLGLLIYLESPGPIIFSQVRCGKNKKPFWCYKFRSMTVNKEMEAVQATKNDMRVTRIGKFIRRTSLDEFPQFFNVLIGNMSIVGPRPHMLKHNEEFQLMEEQYMIRQYLKPGITGWAQVNGYRGEITELFHIKKRVEYDLWYLENWSMSLELQIIFLTVYNVFKGEEKAY